MGDCVSIFYPFYKSLFQIPFPKGNKRWGNVVGDMVGDVVGIPFPKGNKRMRNVVGNVVGKSWGMLWAIWWGMSGVMSWAMWWGMWWAIWWASFVSPRFAYFIPFDFVATDTRKGSKIPCI